MKLYEYYIKNARIDLRCGMHFYLNDLERCNNKRKKLLKLNSKNDALKYFNYIDIKKDTYTEPICFKLEKYIKNIYGSDDLDECTKFIKNNLILIPISQINI